MYNETSSPVAPLQIAPLQTVIPVSPYAIKRYVDEGMKRYEVEHEAFDLSPIWQSLKISPELQTKDFYKQIGFDVDDINSVKDEIIMPREAQIFPLELDNEPGKEVLLSIRDNKESSRYLLFKKDNAKRDKDVWRLLGHIDHNFARHADPKHRVVTGKGKCWLVFDVQTGSGTGFAQYYSRWAEVRDNRLVEVLSHLASQRDNSTSDYPNIEISSRTVGYSLRNGVDALEVLYTFKYSAWDNAADAEIPLWHKQRKAIFIRDATSSKFVPDLSHASTRDLLSDNGELTGYNDEDWLKYNQDVIAKIAAGGDTPRRRWMKDFLERQESSPLVMSLQKQMR